MCTPRTRCRAKSIIKGAVRGSVGAGDLSRAHAGERGGERARVGACGARDRNGRHWQAAALREGRGDFGRAIASGAGRNPGIPF